MDGKTAKELLFTDYKEFHIAGHDLAVAQVTCVDSSNMLSRKEELLTEMRAAAKKKEVSLLILMLTDVLLEGSQLLYVGDDDVISHNHPHLPDISGSPTDVVVILHRWAVLCFILTGPY